MSEQPVIVAVGAHAADQEFAAGATVLKHVRQGWSAHFVNLSLGEKGHAKLTADEYGAQKRTEAEAAAAGLGATTHTLPYRDGEIEVAEPICRELAVLLRQLRPTVVVTHWRHSLHDDHMACHHLTRKAVFMAANRHFDLDGLPPKWARTYYSDNWEDAEGFTPYLFVDVSDVFADYERAFKQFAIGRGEGGWPYWDWYQARCRQHGIAIGVQYAQAFTVEPWQLKTTRELL